MEIRRRHRLVGAFAACVLATCFFARSLHAQTTRPVTAVLRVGMTVSDMDRSIAFFTETLDFKVVSQAELQPHVRVTDLKLGDEMLELTNYPDPGGRKVPPDSRSNDRWFQHIAIVTRDMDAAYKRLQEHHVPAASVAPQRLPDWNPYAGGIRAFYFHDPDDHVLEVIWFPPGKGQERWQHRAELFEGIDHTAIVVADTDHSLAFYRDGLGLRVVGGSENYGIEQERLNNVPGAHLRITTLRAATGPGVELLEYLSPRDGRAYPADSKPIDLIHWQTTLAVPDQPATSFLQDPDGHVMQLVRVSR